MLGHPTAAIDAIHLWNGFYPAKFHLTQEIYERSLCGLPTFRGDLSTAIYTHGELAGFAIVKESGNELYGRAADHRFHLAGVAWRDPDQGETMLRDVIERVSAAGATRLSFGQDSGSAFPGVPVECIELSGVLRKLGFHASETVVDVEADLADLDLPGFPDVRPLLPDESHLLDGFLAREFPGRWRHDVMLKANTDGAEHCVVGYFVEKRLEGMALIQDSAQKLFICGAVWHLSLGEHWGALGPIGVSEAQRGAGHGGRLLQGALAELKHRGGRRCRIDWTTLTEFYGKYGFKVSQTYETFDLALRS